MKMKAAISILLCLVIICLSSCGNTADIDETKPQSGLEAVTVEIKTSSDDPYSYIIKEKYDQTIEYYTKFPQAEFKSENYYFIYDIDGNGTEELLLGIPYIVGGGQNVERPYEIEVMVNEIYTICDGKPVKQEIMSWWMVESVLERSILDNGLIKYVSGPQNRPSYLYVKIINGQTVLLHNLKNQGAGHYYGYLDPETVSEFKSDKTGFDREYELFLKAEEKEITHEEFDRLRAEIEGDAKPVEIEWKNIDQYGR